MRVLCALVLACVCGCASDFELVITLGDQSATSFSMHVDGEVYVPTVLDDGRYLAQFSRHYASYDAARSAGDLEVTIIDSDVEIFRRAIPPAICDEDADWESAELRYGISHFDGVPRVGAVVVCRDGDRVGTTVD